MIEWSTSMFKKNGSNFVYRGVHKLGIVEAKGGASTCLREYCNTENTTGVARLA